MKSSNPGGEWDKLCKEYDVALAQHQKAFSTVNGKMMDIGTGTNTANPTEAELARFETTWARLEAIKRTMAEFVKANT